MDKAKSFFSILGLGITIGVVVVVVLVFVVGAIPKSVNVGGVQFEIPTSTPISSSQNEQVSSVVQPANSISQPPATNSCSAYVTRAQINELKNIQGVSEALNQAQVFSGYLQIDFIPGDRIPAGVLIATDFLTTDIGQYSVIRINSSGGWGLFETTTEIQAPTPGTYRCISE